MACQAVDCSRVIRLRVTMLWLLLLLLSVSRIEATCMCLQTYTVATPATTVVMLSVSARVNFFCCSNNSSMHTHGMIKSLVICGHDSTAQPSRISTRLAQHRAWHLLWRRKVLTSRPLQSQRTS
jgi:hypothetical protein